MVKTRLVVKGFSVAAALSAFFLYAAVARAEHPTEHPSGAGEHKHEMKSGVTKDSLEKAIKDYVKADSALKGGYFLVYDKVDRKPLVLTLEKVHKDRLSKVKEGVYFFCADFKTPDGIVYDLDIFMKDGGMKGMETTEVAVHKKGGKARYDWVEKDGVWSKKAMK